MKIRICFLLDLVLLIGLAACDRLTPVRLVAVPTAAARQPATLTVFAAASLTEPFDEIGHQFEAQHPGVAIIFNFAGSQLLAQQIKDGAPVDVFASANPKQMEAAIDSGRVISGTAHTFSSNRLVVIYPLDNPVGLAQLQDLSKPGLRLLLAAKEVPVGQYALDFLERAAHDKAFGSAFKAGVLQNVVSYENDVKSVLTKVVLGEADAGIVYNSDVSGGSAARVGQIQIPDALNVIARYPLAALRDSSSPELAKAFVEYVLSPQGQAVLSRYGFSPVTK